MKKALFFLITKMFVLVLGVLFALQGCDKSEVAELEDAKPAELFQVNEYNTDLRDFTLAVRNALRSNSGFREFIRDEALRKIDGDYNVILKKVVDKEISSTDGLKSATAGFTVKDLLESYHPNANQYKLKSGTSIIDELMAKYPYLQISVPVHAESWDPVSYTPVVTFMPLEYRDGTTKKVTGYHPDGGIVHLCAIIEPTSPVIVISQNERLPNGTGEEVIEPSPSPPATPTNLRALPTESGIQLVWEMPAGTDQSNTTGYFIFRADAETQIFSRIHTVNGALNRIFFDNNVSARRTYSYYVTAHFQGVESGQSNIVSITAPNFPNPVLSFDAILRSRSSAELRWDNDHSQFISETRLYKKVPGVTNGYQFFRSFTPNDVNFFDNNLHAGKRTFYKIRHASPAGLSNARYDFVRVPYRDYPGSSPVFVKQIKFSCWGLEGWLAGAPEFRIALTNVNKQTKQTFVIQPRMDFLFESRTKSQRFYGRMAMDWRPDIWYDMLTFRVREFDRSLARKQLTLNAGFNFKNPEKTGFNFGLGASATIEFYDNYEEVGNAFLSYFDWPERWLVFPNYGVQILVNDKDW